MNRLPRILRNRVHIFALGIGMGVGVAAVPVPASGLAEPRGSEQEQKVLDEYRLLCRPGRFIEDVRANLYRMQKKHPGSTFLKDSAFLAEVRYLDRGYLWDGNGKRPPEWEHYNVFDTLFNGYAPSREAWSRARMQGFKSTGFAGLGGFLLVANAFLGLHALANPPPIGEQRPVAYRLAHLALPAAWVGSFVYSRICAKRGNRDFDKAFFEFNGKAIAKRLAADSRIP